MKTIITMIVFFMISIYYTFAQDSTHFNYIIPDFQVNRNSGVYNSNQEFPSIASDSSGNFIITWYDKRGQSKSIYAQRYRDDGEPLGSNFKVNDININSGYSTPKICIDKEGNFIIVWDNDYIIFAQSYSNNGAKIGDNFIVNDDEKTKVGSPSMSMDEDGNFVIVWQSNNNIFAQLFSNDRNVIGNNFKVSSGQSPSISSDHKGNFVITWKENNDIYAQRYTSEGVLSGSKIKVNDNSTSFRKPSVATDYNGNFTIVWGNYAQRFSKIGNRIGDNFKVFDIIDYYDSKSVYSSISTNENGDFVIAWNDVNSDAPWFYNNRNIYARCYSNNGTALGATLTVTSYWGPLYVYNYDFDHSIIINNNRSFVITWYDGDEVDDDIYAQRYNADGNNDGNIFRVNNDKEEASYSPSIAVDGDGNFVITWLDFHKSYEGVQCDIFVQRYSDNGIALGNNIKLNRKITEDNEPSIATDSSGNFVIAWEENDCIYTQRFSNNGSAIDSSFKVNDTHDSLLYKSSMPSVALNNNGNFVIVWLDDNVYAQQFSKDGLPIGNNIKVNDDLGNYLKVKPYVSIDKDGNFMVAWSVQLSKSPHYQNIYAQRYKNDGTPLGNNFKVNEIAISDYVTSLLSICSDKIGNFVITWYGDEDIYAQRYLNDGTPQGNNFKVNDLKINDPWWHSISISADEMGNYIIVWQNFVEDYNVFVQRFSKDGSPIGNNFILCRYVNSINVKLWNGGIYTTWSAADDNEIGENIYANVIDWDIPTSITEKRTSEIPTKFALFQNYPNPFNPITTIEYSISSTSNPLLGGARGGLINVQLKVYDILGREIAVLVNEVQRPGYYEVRWDASNQPNGVYFYQIKAIPIGRQAGNFIQTKKMLLLK